MRKYAFNQRKQEEKACIVFFVRQVFIKCDCYIIFVSNISTQLVFVNKMFFVKLLCYNSFNNKSTSVHKSATCPVDESSE